MRLSEYYRTTIKEILTKHFGKEGRFYLFGSRVDDSKRGGDIDLYVETELDFENSYNAKLHSHIDLMKALGEQKIDIVVYRYGTELLPIHNIAKMTGIEL